MPPAEPFERPDFMDDWDYRDPAATEAKFRARLAAAPPGPDRLKLLTQIARTHSLRKNFDAAHALLDEVERALSLEPDAAVEVRLLLERGRSLNSAGAPDIARPLFERAWEIAQADALDGLAVDAAHMIAITLQSAPERALEWNRRALALAESSPDPDAQRWVGSLANNLGWTYHDRGEHESARACFERCLHFNEAHGKAREALIARWSMAKMDRALGRLDAALAQQRRLIEEWEARGEPDGFVFEEAGECLLALGRADEARPIFARAHELLADLDWLDPARLDRLRTLSR